MEMMSPERAAGEPVLPRRRGRSSSRTRPTRCPTTTSCMSMRGNNIHFSHATVFHEMIPGHHLAGLHGAALPPAPRRRSATPFSVEGWALLLGDADVWDLGFAEDARETASARCSGGCTAARASSSRSNFHLGKMTPRAVHRLPGRPRRPRARQRDGRGAPLVQRRLLAALSGRLHARRAAVPRAARRSWSIPGKMTNAALPRRDPEGGRHARSR